MPSSLLPEWAPLRIVSVQRHNLLKDTQLAKFINESNHSVTDDTRKRFELDARIYDRKKEFDALRKKGQKIPPSPFAQRIAARTN